MTVTKESVPADLRDTYDYIVDCDGVGEVNKSNEIRLLLRKSTLGEAVELVAQAYSDLKATIRMPIPRQQPWTELPALTFKYRSAAGLYLRLDDHARANLIELLKACGSTTDGVEPFTLARGRGWMGPVMDQLIAGDPPAIEPDFTYDELVDDVGGWLKSRLRQSTAEVDTCPKCGSQDVLIENGLRGCKKCGETTERMRSIVGKVLFLDVDGVANSGNWFKRRGPAGPEHGPPGSDEYMARRQIDPATIPLLNSIVDRTGCHVVLSSTWRHAHGMVLTRFCFRYHGATFEIVDRTPRCAQKFGLLYIGQERGAEIAEWLEEHPGVTSFAIVDDDGDMGPLKHRLVQTSWTWGLTPELAEKLVELLGVKDGAAA